MEPGIPEEGAGSCPRAIVPILVSAAQAVVWKGGSAPICCTALGWLLLVRFVASVDAAPLRAAAAFAAALGVWPISAVLVLASTVPMVVWGGGSDPVCVPVPSLWSLVADVVPFVDALPT